jgi:hypothetical protein
MFVLALYDDLAIRRFREYDCVVRKSDLMVIADELAIGQQYLLE